MEFLPTPALSTDTNLWVLNNTQSPDPPRLLLANGSFDKAVVIYIRQAGEGLLLTPPLVTYDEEFTGHVVARFKGSATDLVYISNTLYPLKFNGNVCYATHIDRGAFFIEFLITWNTDYLNRLFNNKTYTMYTDTILVLMARAALARSTPDRAPI